MSTTFCKVNCTALQLLSLFWSFEMIKLLLSSQFVKFKQILKKATKPSNHTDIEVNIQHDY